MLTQRVWCTIGVKNLTHNSYGTIEVGNQNVEYMSVYRYLRVHINEHLELSGTTDTLSNAGGRALGSVISKIQGPVVQS